MFKKINFLLFFLLILISSSFAGIVNSYSNIYSTTTESSSMALKGDMYITSNTISGVPTSARVELHSTGNDSMILRDGNLKLDGSSAYIKFNDNTLQNSAGVGSSGNIANTSDAIIMSDSDGDSSGDILFKVYNSTAAVIDNLTLNTTFYSDVYVSTVAVDNIQVKTASGDLIIKNQAGSEIATFGDDRRLNATKIGEEIINVTTGITAGTTHDFALSTRFESGIVVISASRGGNTVHEINAYSFGGSDTAGSISSTTLDAQTAECFSVAYLSTATLIHTYRLTVGGSNLDTLKITKISFQV